MRGTLKETGKLRRVKGIIPADAGNTRVLEYISRLSGDHPRGCGEHYFSWISLMGK